MVRIKRNIEIFLGAVKKEMKRAICSIRKVRRLLVKSKIICNIITYVKFEEVWFLIIFLNVLGQAGLSSILLV